MPKLPQPILALAAAALLLAHAAEAADYKCAKPETGVKLNDSDIEIKQRAEVVAEIKAEIAESGGTTDQHKQALDAFEGKLAKAKADREALMKECGSASAP